MRTENKFCVSDFGSDAARAHETPTANGFKKGEQTCDHKNQPEPKRVVHYDNARDKAERADDTARDASAMADVGSEKAVHTKKLAQCVPKTTGSLQEKLAGNQKLRHIFRTL